MITSDVRVHGGSLKAKLGFHTGTTWLDLTVNHGRDTIEITLFPSADLPKWKMERLAAAINEVMEMKMSETNNPPEGTSTPGEASRPIDPIETNAEATPDVESVPSAPVDPYPVDPSTNNSTNDSGA